MRILIVEDNTDAADLLAHLLRRDGHDARAAMSVDEALAANDRDDFELLICDIGLPGCDGWALLGRLRSRRAIPAIALTGYGRPADVEHSRAAGFDAHLTKPFQADALAAAIATITRPVGSVSAASAAAATVAQR
jgi:CheY-like chemotaxis protein